jgi:hypothetical protein
MQTSVSRVPTARINRVYPVAVNCLVRTKKAVVYVGSVYIYRTGGDGLIVSFQKKKKKQEDATNYAHTNKVSFEGRLF